jgi:Skp family chaperone for outer membrane proteins
MRLNVFKALSVVFALLSVGGGSDTVAQQNTQEETDMSIDLNTARQEVYAQVESWIKTAQAKLENVENQAEGKMAKVEVEAYETLLPKLQAIQQKLQQLKKSSGKQWKQLKADIERLIADFEKSVKQIEAEAKAS